MGTSPSAQIQPADPIEPPSSWWQKKLRGLGNGLIELAIHAIGLIAILLFIRLIEKTLQLLWGTDDVVFFEHLKLKYVFQAVDVFLLIGFLIKGTYRFLKVFNTD